MLFTKIKLAQLARKNLANGCVKSKKVKEANKPVYGRTYITRKNILDIITFLGNPR